MKTVQFHTLGCKLNFSETSTLAREFQSGGFHIAKKGEKADIYIINSCSVTAEADKKCRNIIRRLARKNPLAIVAVTGCYAQLKPEEIAQIEGVDIVVGNNDKGTLLDQILGFKGKQVVNHCQAQELTNFFASFSSGDRTRSFLKVQDGCSYQCTYCTIPLARGESRNIPIAELVVQAEEIASKGQREIVLTGVNTGDFGQTTGESFIDLLKALEKVDGIERYRISSIEPNLLTDEIITFCTGSRKFQPHFHIPLQAGSDKILALMRRRYNIQTFRDRIQAVRAQIPDAFIGIDVIVGFPGESEENFEDSYKFLESLKPSFLHIFPYSERADTPAINFPNKVSPQKKQERVSRLEELSSRLHIEFGNKFIGKNVRILVESAQNKDQKMYGYSENYLRVELPYQKELINTIVEKKITAITSSGIAVID